MLECKNECSMGFNNNGSCRLKDVDAQRCKAREVPKVEHFYELKIKDDAKVDFSFREKNGVRWTVSLITILAGRGNSTTNYPPKGVTCTSEENGTVCTNKRCPYSSAHLRSGCSSIADEAMHLCMNRTCDAIATILIPVDLDPTIILNYRHFHLNARVGAGKNVIGDTHFELYTRSRNVT